jgi:hypothetical protein|tara:strand:- start:124 stop:1272 length:1149 start_codon:yes stop_codon:yes gene_type:complete
MSQIDSQMISTGKKKDHQSIDEKHQEMMNIFKLIEESTIPGLEKDVIDLQYCIYKKPNKTEEYYEIKEKIKNKKREISILRQKKKKYLLDNVKYIFHYYEDKQKTSTGYNVKDTSTINHFFKIKGKNDESSDFNSEKYKQSKQLYQEYWKNVNGEIPNLHDYVLSCHNCLICNQGELIPLEEEGVLICNNVVCGKFIVNIIDNQKPLNKEMPNEVSYTAYIRLNHFKEILSQFQAKETTKIPDELFDAVRNRIVKERKQLKEVNYAEMRSILSTLGYNKYFEHIQYINSILGIKPPVMDEELHETLCVLFIEIQQPWALFCPTNRTNFFNYTYILCQLCVLLNQTQYLPYIPMMKDRIKQLEQDMIWKDVCTYLDWEYFPTV